MLVETGKKKILKDGMIYRNPGKLNIQLELQQRLHPLLNN